MRFTGCAFRAHDPRWAFKPRSGEGAALKGGRFNPKRVPALYLALTIEGAVLEASQGFAYKIEPLTLCAYDVDCDDVLEPRGLKADGLTARPSADLDASQRGHDPSSIRTRVRLTHNLSRGGDDRKSDTPTLSIGSR